MICESDKDWHDGEDESKEQCRSKNIYIILCLEFYNIHYVSDGIH